MVLYKSSNEYDLGENKTMANMSYCRWRNTLEDLRDCLENVYESVGSEEEARAKRKILAICQEMAGIDADSVCDVDEDF